MSQSQPHITDAELAILQLLWDKGSAAVRALADSLYPGGGPSEYATVHRLLERLEAKGYVRRGREGGRYAFFPVRDRDAVLGEQLEVLLCRMGSGSLQPLLTNLLRSRHSRPRSCANC